VNYEAILFDMDGVIVDTYQSVTALWQNLAQRYQVHLVESDFSQHIYGCPATHTLDVLFPDLSADQRDSITAMMVQYETHLTYTAVQGAVTFLRALKELCFPTALVTSGEHWKVHAVVTQLGIDGMFSTQITAGDIQKGKPHPECYLLAAQRLQKAPERCIVFEDSISGTEAAVASGAACIGIGPSSTAPPLLETGACSVVPDFSSVTLQDRKGQGGTTLDLQIGAELHLSLSHRA
jgi:HAD superfamily hydrolase (TIGR01509 family)